MQRITLGLVALIVVPVISVGLVFSTLLLLALGKAEAGSTGLKSAIASPVAYPVWASPAGRAASTAPP